MKKLPKLYKNENYHLINHNRKEFHIIESLFDDDRIITLDEIFQGLGHPYNQKVLIQTKKKEYLTYLVSRTKQNVFTLDNEVIPIEEILSIKKVD